MRINISDFEKAAQVNIVKQRTFLFLTKLGSEVNRPTSRISVNILVNINPIMKNQNSFYEAFRAKGVKVPIFTSQ
jgi:transcriptional regulator